jgi:hypothetical protein
VEEVKATTYSALGKAIVPGESEVWKVELEERKEERRGESDEKQVI